MTGRTSLVPAIVAAGVLALLCPSLLAIACLGFTWLAWRTWRRG